jgi:hypothetical protein
MNGLPDFRDEQSLDTRAIHRFYNSCGQQFIAVNGFMKSKRLFS